LKIKVLISKMKVRHSISASQKVWKRGKVLGGWMDGWMDGWVQGWLTATQI
jgi:hypothetical protein